ncbi:MAG: FtsX-like permease family protein, partial [Sphingobacteriaceae bacterium]
MIKNYLKNAWRSLQRDKTISIISIGGLSLGIACFLLLGTYILNELRYDRFHAKANRIVRVMYSYKSADDPEASNNAVTPSAVVPVFKRTFSEIEDGTRVFNYAYKPIAVQLKNKTFNERNFLVADASFFKIFSFNFVTGNPATALLNPNSVVITASTAKKYFGSENPAGKTLTIDQKAWQVTGVIANIPPYSQLKFDFLGSYSTLERSKTEQWSSANDVSYFLLKNGGPVPELQKKMNAYVQNQFPEKFTSGNKFWFELEPLTRVHLYSKTGSGKNIKYIYILSAIAVLLLLIACINFINLITAKSAERAHEIGVRKVLGAERKQIFFQFMAESAIVTLIAIFIGLFVSALALPIFNRYTSLDLSIRTWNGTWLFSILSLLFLLITAIAGTWPALVLSAFQPVKVLKGAVNKSSSGSTLRKALVVFQFTISIAFIIATIIAGRQLYFIQHTNTGINRSQILVLDAGISNQEFEPLKNELLKNPDIKSVTASYDSPVNVQGGYSLGVQEKSPDFSLSVTAIPVEKDFVSVLGIKILQGMNFTNSDILQVQTKDEDKRRYAFMLNKTAVEAMGWTPEQAIGKQVNMNGRIGEIKAVLEDFNFASLHEKITPIAVFAEYNWFGK